MGDPCGMKKNTQQRQVDFEPEQHSAADLILDFGYALLLGNLNMNTE